MGSSFGSFDIAKSGLYVSRQALDVVGHNITNADTVGYTRQRISTESIDPYSVEGRFLTLTASAVGRGVEAINVDQIRSDYLDRQFRNENSDFGMWDKRAEELGYIETVLSNGTKSNISEALSDFYNSLNELSSDPVSEEIRTNVVQNALALTETFNHYSEKLIDQQNLYNDTMEVVTTNINEYLDTITEYNKQIQAYELSGQPANDLRDRRNVMLDELSGLVNIEYYETADLELVVTVEGTELINHDVVTLLEARAELTGVVSGEPDYYEIYLEGTNTVFSYSSGELQAYKDLRDGNTVDSVGIPKILDNMNILARSLTEEFNTINNAGYTIPYGVTPSQTGVDFFEVPVGGLGDVTAKNFSISAAIEESGFNIAASDELVDLSAINTQQGNNVNALNMVVLTERSDIPTVSNFDGYLESSMIEVAIESSYASKISISQSTLVSNIENRRQSISGVSVDEEMIEMVKHQHAYTAASRLLTTLDEMLDKLINSTGLVGR